MKSSRTAIRFPPGYELLKHVEQTKNNQTRLEQVVVKKKAENGLAGDIIKSAMVVRGNLGEPQIDFTLTADGAKRFGETTRENVGHRLAIILDGELYSAPNIQSAIETGNGQITGSYTIETAMELANVLQNPLKAPLHIVYTSDVGATLGADSIRSGIKASIYGVAVRVPASCWFIISSPVSRRTSRSSPTSSSCSA